MLPPTDTVKYGFFVGSLVWDRLPKDVKSSATFNIRGKVKHVAERFLYLPKMQIVVEFICLFL